MALVKATELDEAIAGVLSEFNKDVQYKIRGVVDRSMQELITITRATAPHKTGKYRRHIAQKVTSDTLTDYERTWYVSGAYYRLTHLLEAGHQKANGGRVEGTHFLSNAVRQITGKYVEQVKEALSGG